MCEEREPISISIVLPVFNVTDHIERCVQSVMSQSFPCTECIIVDDASTDDSIAKCEQLIDSYRGPIEFKILHHELNRGLSAARNTGTDAATSDYILYLDSDDELTPDCLEKLSQSVYDDASVEMVLGYYDYITNDHPTVYNKQHLRRRVNINSLEAVRNYFYNNEGWFPIQVWNKLVKRDFLVRNHIAFIEGILFEDNPWTYSVFKYLSHLYIVPEITYHYYKRADSIWISSTLEVKAKYFGMIFEGFASDFTPGEEAREASFYLRNFCQYYLNYPEMPPYKRTADRFKKALQDGHHKKELVFLFLTEQASKTSIGRFLFPFVLKARIALLYPFRRLTSLKAN